jgi:hypothetical protein
MDYDLKIFTEKMPNNLGTPFGVGNFFSKIGRFWTIMSFSIS